MKKMTDEEIRFMYEQNTIMAQSLGRLTALLSRAEKEKATLAKAAWDERTGQFEYVIKACNDDSSLKITENLVTTSDEHFQSWLSKQQNGNHNDN